MFNSNIDVKKTLDLDYSTQRCILRWAVAASQRMVMISLKSTIGEQRFVLCIFGDGPVTSLLSFRWQTLEINLDCKLGRVAHKYNIVGLKFNRLKNIRANPG
mmetsp:Transcript_54067/g.143067  ORF Transcript_54067/g.143067 Transcript_54067/m.143067 type:complete len:102 (+) Transcript_54067:1171-1476(+)